MHPKFDVLRCDIAAVGVDHFFLSPKAEVRHGGLYYERYANHPLKYLPAINNRQVIDRTPSAPYQPHEFVSDMFLPIGPDAVVFGYPGAVHFEAYAVGVSAKIASNQPWQDSPYMLVSGGPYKGCSGGPVVARSFG